jgi:hypothetical protein
MLLFLMLAVAVLTITLMGVARNYRRSILRDREVEMMHRGDQYSRAVKRFYKKNGSYPASLDQLEKLNNIRYLRKRYKDPMSPNGEWKLVNPSDVQLTPTGGLTPAGTNTGTLPGQSPATAGLLGGVAGAAVQNPATPNAPNTTTSDTGTSNTGTADTGTGNSSSSTGMGDNPATSGQVLGGGPILGVVSKQKAEGIHSFGDKKKYNEWFFIYDPSQDRGQLLVGPYNPNMILGAAGTGLTSTPAPGGSSTPGAGNVTGAAPSSGFSSTPSTPAPSAPASTPMQ